MEVRRRASLRLKRRKEQGTGRKEQGEGRKEQRERVKVKGEKVKGGRLKTALNLGVFC